jgi:hypothetical protein
MINLRHLLYSEDLHYHPLTEITVWNIKPDEGPLTTYTGGIGYTLGIL